MAYLTAGQQIIQLLKDNLGTGTFKAYFFGDPHLIGKSSLPCIIVEEQGASTSVDYTQMDSETKSIVIKLVYDKRDDWGASDTVDTTFAKIRDAIDGRDPNTGQYLEKSLKGILRTSFTLSNNNQPVPGGIQPYSVNQTMKTRYFVQSRPEDTYTQEGHLTMEVTELVVVLNRT
jgi:hypothetical protein